MIIYEAEEIVQFEDSDVIIKFNNNKNARLSTSSRQSFKTSSERFYTPANTICTLFFPGVSGIRVVALLAYIFKPWRNAKISYRLS